MDSIDRATPSGTAAGGSGRRGRHVGGKRLQERPTALTILILAAFVGASALVIPPIQRLSSISKVGMPKRSR